MKGDMEVKDIQEARNRADRMYYQYRRTDHALAEYWRGRFDAYDAVLSDGETVAVETESQILARHQQECADFERDRAYHAEGLR